MINNSNIIIIINNNNNIFKNICISGGVCKIKAKAGFFAELNVSLILHFWSLHNLICVF